jgi:hypothetical protein
MLSPLKSLFSGTNANPVNPVSPMNALADTNLGGRCSRDDAPYNGSFDPSIPVPREEAATDNTAFDIPSPEARRPERDLTVRYRPRIKALKAQALERRETLPDLLDGLIEGQKLSRKDTLDLVMAVIEDAHSADPVLFGPDAADLFARLHQARRGLDV